MISNKKNQKGETFVNFTLLLFFVFMIFLVVTVVVTPDSPEKKMAAPISHYITENEKTKMAQTSKQANTGSVFIKEDQTKALPVVAEVAPIQEKNHQNFKSIKEYNDDLQDLDKEKRKLSKSLKEELAQVSRLFNIVNSGNPEDVERVNGQYIEAQKKVTTLTHEFISLNKKIADISNERQVKLKADSDEHKLILAQRENQEQETANKVNDKLMVAQTMAKLSDEMNKLQEKQKTLEETYNQKIKDLQELEKRIDNHKQKIAMISKPTNQNQEIADPFAPPKNIPKEHWSGITEKIKR